MLQPDELAALDAACAPGPGSDRALKAFYGAKDEGPRAQEVFTPLTLIAPLREVWGGIRLDPCAHPHSPVSAIAEVAWYGEACEWTEKKGVRVPVAWTGKGLTSWWMQYTYCNPPFRDLEEWCAKARSEDGPWALLAPARTQRRWLRETIREADATVALNTVTFEGFDQGFPQGLLLIVRSGQVLSDLISRAYEGSGLGERLC